MLRAIDIKCPNCHAPQSLRQGQVEVSCPYCRHQFLVERTGDGHAAAERTGDGHAAAERTGDGPAAAERAGDRAAAARGSGLASSRAPIPVGSGATAAERPTGKKKTLPVVIVMLVGAVLATVLLALMFGLDTESFLRSQSRQGALSYFDALPLSKVITEAEAEAAKLAGDATVMLIGVEVSRLQEGKVDPRRDQVATIRFGTFGTSAPQVIEVAVSKGTLAAQVLDQRPPHLEARIPSCTAASMWREAVRSGMPEDATPSLRLEQAQGQWQWAMVAAGPPQVRRVFAVDTCQLIAP